VCDLSAVSDNSGGRERGEEIGAGSLQINTAISQMDAAIFADRRRDLRRSTPRSSQIDAAIFADRCRDLQRSAERARKYF
jgi:hypothetical protein